MRKAKKHRDELSLCARTGHENPYPNDKHKEPREIADMFTKPFDKILLRKFRNLSGMVDVGGQPQGEC